MSEHPTSFAGLFHPRPVPTEADLKQRAWDMKILTGEKIGHCYEVLAKQYGFRTYAAMRAAHYTRHKGSPE